MSGGTVSRGSKAARGGGGGEEGVGGGSSESVSAQNGPAWSEKEVL